MSFVRVQELWDGFNPAGFGSGIFMLFRGYIDESYSGEATPRMFGLTCTFTYGSEWSWIEMAWQNCLDEKNASLKQQGRKAISRYHSTDINGFRGEFQDWDGVERQAFCEKLVKVFARHEIGFEGYVVDVRDLVEFWPEIKDDPLEMAYDVLQTFLMLEIGAGFHLELPDSKVTLFHERCPHDGVFLQSFNRMMEDPTFAYRQHFTTIAPMGWEDCIPLQPADLMAYENFKEGLRQLPDEKPRDRRKILTEIISLKSVGAHLKHIDRPTMVKLKGIYDAAAERKRISELRKDSDGIIEGATQHNQGEIGGGKIREKAEEI